MITLTISSSLPQFTQFLLERCGIEGNILTVDEARAAARNGCREFNGSGGFAQKGLSAKEI